MSEQGFTAGRGPILVEADAVGPTGRANLRLVLDTGATTSLINLATLLYLGFDPDQPLRRVQMTTGSSVEVVPVLALTRLGALGRNLYGFTVIAHTLPASSAVDGLLGLDFSRGCVLTVDFRAEKLALL